MRWIRDYRLVVGIKGKAIEIRPPLKVAFNCTKSIFGGTANKLVLQVWNLTEAHRNALIKDEWESKYIPVSLEVGYQGQLSLLFKGNLFIGGWQREGADFISTLEMLDGGFDILNAFTAKVADSSQSAAELALTDMKNTTKGKFTQPPALTRPKVLVGNSSQLILDSLPDKTNFFIDNEQAFILAENEVREGYAPLVTAKTGLIDVEFSKGELQLTTIMNPMLKIGGLFKLESTRSAYNGVYRIEEINYVGDSHGNDWIQNLTARAASNYRVPK